MEARYLFPTNHDALYVKLKTDTLKEARTWRKTYRLAYLRQMIPFFKLVFVFVLAFVRWFWMLQGKNKNTLPVSWGLKGISFSESSDGGYKIKRLKSRPVREEAGGEAEDKRSEEGDGQGGNNTFWQWRMNETNKQLSQQGFQNRHWHCLTCDLWLA